MRRRSLLAGLAGGLYLPGCTALAPGGPGRIPTPSGFGTVRPLDEPYLQYGLSTESEQYLYARLFRPGDSFPATDNPNAASLSERVDDLKDDQFALFSNLRTAAAVPAYLWPDDTEWDDGTLRVELTRNTKEVVEGHDEAVGVALAVFDNEGTPPDRVELVAPGGARLSV